MVSTTNDLELLAPLPLWIVQRRHAFSPHAMQGPVAHLDPPAFKKTCYTSRKTASTNRCPDTIVYSNNIYTQHFLYLFISFNIIYSKACSLHLSAFSEPCDQIDPPIHHVRMARCGPPPMRLRWTRSSGRFCCRRKRPRKRFSR